jgi:hypothetical protein
VNLDEKFRSDGSKWGRESSLTREKTGDHREGQWSWDNGNELKMLCSTMDGGLDMVMAPNVSFRQGFDSMEGA